MWRIAFVDGASIRGATMKGFGMATNETARAALYETIETLAKELSEDKNAYSGASAVRDLAIAWRAVVGGQQPGSIVVENK